MLMHRVQDNKISCPSSGLWPANDLCSPEAERHRLALPPGRFNKRQSLATESNLTDSFTWQLQQQICFMCFTFTYSLAKGPGPVLTSCRYADRLEKKKKIATSAKFPAKIMGRRGEKSAGSPLPSTSHLGPLADPAANCLQHVWLNCQ